MTIDLLSTIEREGIALAAACGRADPAAPVAACPGWDVRELLWHMVGVNDLWSGAVEHRWASPREHVRRERPTEDSLEAIDESFRDSLVHVLDVLRTADPEQHVWSWNATATTSWVIRRLAHETAVHRWDAELAVGESPLLDPELASDGIDEFLTEMLGRVSPGAAAVGGSVHLHCTDVDGEWTIRPDADGALVVAREHAKGDAAIRGNAADLLLVLWRRLPLSSVEVIGDAAVAERFVAG